MFIQIRLHDTANGFQKNNFMKHGIHSKKWPLNRRNCAVNQTFQIELNIAN